MEIEVGEYCRSKYGEIGIITNIYPQIMWRKKKNPSLLDYNLIKSHSKNIIDLIEVGDFVNGHKILEIKQNLESGLRYLMYDYVPIKYYVERTDKIKSILTKEQYEQNSYNI